MDQNNRSFRISAVQPADVHALHRLVRELAEYEQLTEICVSTESDLRDALFGAGPAAEALVARLYEDSEVIVGFALYFHTYSTFLGRRSLWLEDLFVRPEYRRAGLGRRFLTELAGIARDRGCGRFEWAVLDWNTPSIAFYERLGARHLSDWLVYRLDGDALQSMGT